MNRRCPLLILVLLSASSFKFQDRCEEYTTGEKRTNNLLGYKHTVYYKTGEIKFVCHEHHTGFYGKGTGIIRKYNFKRHYYDRCGNLKLIVLGKREEGCWRNEVKILKVTRKNESSFCEKEEFIYPGISEIEKD
ncbi:MAG: hypothetical protein ACJ75J_04175 [Cytophagaceae bacterium]